MPSCFKPLINDQSKLLILGTLPGPESLERDEYYANPTNQFWEIIYSVFNEPVDSEYSARCKFILEHRLALWDVLDNADREGARDNDIKNEAPNDFGELFRHYSNIEHLLFNGANAEKYFKKYNKFYYKTMHCQKFSSTSNMPGRYVKTLEEKKIEWEMAILKEC